MSKTENQKSKEPASINPFNQEVIARYAFDTAAQIESELGRVEKGYRVWRDASVADRSRVLMKLGAILKREERKFGALITTEMGKPITQARAEILKCAGLCEWYAENGPAMLHDEPAKMPSGEAYVSYLPIGPIFAVMPWNFPFWQVLRGAVAILLGGNSYVLKHSSNVMGAAYALRDAFKEAGLPEGVFSVMNIGHETAANIIRDARIAAVTVTGSVRAGRSVAATAGSVLKKSVLELGGADPFIVLADADLERAVAAAVEARYQNTGQVCIAAKRFIVEKSVLPNFTELFVAKVKALRIGDPMKSETYLGPMARRDLRDELHKQVLKSKTEGAQILCGGEALGGEFERGAFYAPTVLADVKPGMTAFKEEIFGPVAALISARDAEDAIQLANNSDFGLSSAIWSADAVRAKSFARRLETGGVFINGLSATDARVPVGGTKQSGYGRELSHFGMHEFLNAQTVWIDRK